MPTNSDGNNFVIYSKTCQTVVKTKAYKLYLCILILQLTLSVYV